MTKREFQKAEYEAEVTEPASVKTCRTCHWWHLDICVWHNGLLGRASARLDFTGTLRTKADFVCSEWRKDERPNKD